MKISSSEPLLNREGSPVAPDFVVYTGAMEIDSERENVVRMIGSSTEQDLHGDTMAISALTDMSMVEPGLLIWLNHWYELPGSLFGSLIEKPELRLKDGIADIHIASDVETTNPDAVQTYGYIKKGRRVGCSIGCIILEAEIDKDNDDGGWWPPLIIQHVRTLEWSIVGIPANQRCWPETAGKGLFNRMLSEGRGDEALALAPMVKGLYPKAFQDKLRDVNDEALRRDLERIEIKGNPKSRIEWVPNERMFVMNQKGAYKPIDRKDISAFMAKSKETPRLSGFLARETTPGVVVRTVEGFDVGAALRGESIDIKGASGKTSWPLADEDTAWDKGAAHKRIMEWAGGDDPDWSKVKSVHFWFDDEKADTWGGYKLPFCDRIGDEIKAVPHAIYACTGGHGLSASDIPDADVPAIKKKIEVYYHKLGKKAPWEDQDDKEEAMEPDKETDVKDQVTLLTNNASGSTEVAEQIPLKDYEAGLAPKDTPAEPEQKEEASPASPLDVQLFNALAARLGQPVITLDSQGQVQATKAFPELTPEAIQEAIAKALNFGETVKAGSEFSAKNKKALQDLHDAVYEMCKASFHPCEEMAANNDDDNDDDDDGKEKGVLSAELITNAEIPALREDFKALIETLKSQGHLIDAKAVRDLMARIEAADKRLKDIQATTKQAEERLASLQNAPLGQPTLLKRGIQGPDTASYNDFKALAQRSAVATMNDNERRWSLEEALGLTTIVPKTVAGEERLYRLWPDGVGGSVRDGIRPALTGKQRTGMHPGDQVAYTEGEEAAVPCYDDPGNVEM